VLGADLHTLSRERLFDPLGMHSTTFHPERLERDRIAPTEIDPWRGGEVRGAVHDESAWRLREIMYPGSAGLFSTVADLTRFLAMALRGGRYRGVRVLSARTIDLIQHNQLAAIGHSAALGWELNQARYMGRRCSERTIGKTGFTGCVVIVDFERERGVVMLSNYTWPRRKAGPDPINAVRAAVADAVFG
jgi:CubicO group peptidase (beta-lactamase class C family)